MGMKQTLAQRRNANPNSFFFPALVFVFSSRVIVSACFLKRREASAQAEAHTRLLTVPCFPRARTSDLLELL